jgi:transposase
MLKAVKDQEEAIIKHRHEILLCGQEQGVSAACKKYRISRTLYYRWHKRFDEQGLAGLKDQVRHFVPPNKSALAVEQAVLDAIVSFPDYGPQSIAWLLEEQDLKISSSGVYNIIRRHELNHKPARKHYSRKISTAKQQSAAAELEVRPARAPEPAQLTVGECWLAWTVERGYQPGIGNLYQYAVVDLISGVACARLYTKKNADCALDLLLGVAIPMGNELLMQPSWIMTPHQVEYTTGRIHSRHLYTSKLREMNIKQVIWEEKNNLYSKTVQVFNQKSGAYLESLLELADSFDVIKDGFQQFVRDYNLELPLGYGKNSHKTPMEIVVDAKGPGVTLPLWSYVNRKY